MLKTANLQRGLIHILQTSYADIAMTHAQASFFALAEEPIREPSYGQASKLRSLGINWSMLAKKTHDRIYGLTGGELGITLLFAVQAALCFPETFEKMQPDLYYAMLPLQSYFIHRDYPTTFREVQNLVADKAPTWNMPLLLRFRRFARVWLNDSRFRNAVVGQFTRLLEPFLLDSGVVNTLVLGDTIPDNGRWSWVNMPKLLRSRVGKYAEQGWEQDPDPFALKPTQPTRLSEAAEWSRILTRNRAGVCIEGNYALFNVREMLRECLLSDEQTFYCPYTRAELEEMVVKTNTLVRGQNPFEVGLAMLLPTAKTALSVTRQVSLATFKKFATEHSNTEALERSSEHCMMLRRDVIETVGGIAARARPKPVKPNNGDRATYNVRTLPLTLTDFNGDPLTVNTVYWKGRIHYAATTFADTKQVGWPAKETRRLRGVVYVTAEGLDEVGKREGSSYVAGTATKLSAAAAAQGLDTFSSWRRKLYEVSQRGRAVAGQRTRGGPPFTLDQDAAIYAHCEPYDRALKAVRATMPEHNAYRFKQRAQLLFAAKEKGLTVNDVRNLSLLEATLGAHVVKRFQNVLNS